MSFFSLLPVRDEADIISQAIEYALRWADGVFVFDTGSIDNTWEIILDMSKQDSRVHPVRRQPVYYSESRVRGYLFDEARHYMRDGDWFVRMDADEFHHIEPPMYVRELMGRGETVAWHQYYDFRLTDTEADAWLGGAVTRVDRSRPIELRRRYYVPSYYSEPRLCRYRSTMKWPESVSFPFNAGYVARNRLPIRHYPHRDPDQLERRCLLRAVMMADKENRKHWTRPDLHHWSEKEWRRFVTPHDDKDLRHWNSGEDLPALEFTSHLRNPLARLAQRVVHPLFLPLLDARRASFKGEEVLQPIPADVQDQLESALRIIR